MPTITARRVDALTTLARPAQGQAISRHYDCRHFATPAPAQCFCRGDLYCAAWARASISKLFAGKFLADNGYHRSDTVREAGEFAIRGGIVDLFSSSGDEPVRLDLFGDEVENIRSFDRPFAAHDR